MPDKEVPRGLAQILRDLAQGLLGIVGGVMFLWWSQADGVLKLNDFVYTGMIIASIVGVMLATIKMSPILVFQYSVYVLPEECIGELQAKYIRLLKAKKPSHFIQIIMLWHFLELLWAIHVHIRIYNFWFERINLFIRSAGLALVIARTLLVLTK